MSGLWRSWTAVAPSASDMSGSPDSPPWRTLCSSLRSISHSRRAARFLRIRGGRVEKISCYCQFKMSTSLWVRIIALKCKERRNRIRITDTGLLLSFNRKIQEHLFKFNKFVGFHFTGRYRYLAFVGSVRSNVFWPPGFASGSVSHKYGSGYGSGSGSFHHQAKIVRKNLDFFCCVTSLWIFDSVPDPHPDLDLSIRMFLGIPDLHQDPIVRGTDPSQSVTDPQRRFEGVGDFNVFPGVISNKFCDLFTALGTVQGGISHTICGSSHLVW